MTERQKDKKTERQRDRKTERQKDRKTKRQKGKKTERPKDNNFLSKIKWKLKAKKSLISFI